MIKVIQMHWVWRLLFTPLAYRREQQRITYLNQVKAEVVECFDKLPRCSASVVLVSPAHYRNCLSQDRHRFLPDSIHSGEVRGEIYIAPFELADFLIARQEQHYSSDESAIWVNALIGWLKKADLSVEMPTSISRSVSSEILDSSISEILKKFSIGVFCWDCRRHYSHLVHESHSPRLMKGWNFIEETWCCESGHLMFKFIEEIHVIGYFPRT
jgi:hypothetical protein